ncbi:GNAT family N-acetyltransferase, partial [Elusimicrobiota bacterium]
VSRSLKKKYVDEDQIDPDIAAGIESGFAAGIPAGINVSDIDAMFEGSIDEIVARLHESLDIEDNQTASDNLKSVLQEMGPQYLKQLLKLYVTQARKPFYRVLPAMIAYWMARIAGLPTGRWSQYTLQNRRLVLLLTRDDLLANGDVLAHSGIYNGQGTIYMHINALANVITKQDTQALRMILKHEDGDINRGFGHEEDLPQAEFDSFVRPLWDRNISISGYQDLLAEGMTRDQIMSRALEINNTTTFSENVKTGAAMMVKHENTVPVFARDTEGNIVGYMLLMSEETKIGPKTYPEGYLLYMAVHSDYRNQGIGRSLFFSAVSEARKLGLDNIKLTFNKGEPQEKFYEQMAGDFNVTDRYIEPRWTDGKPGVMIVYDISRHRSRIPFAARLRDTLHTAVPKLAGSALTLLMYRDGAYKLAKQQLFEEEEVAILDILNDLGSEKEVLAAVGLENRVISPYEFMIERNIAEKLVDLYETDRDLARKAYGVMLAYERSKLRTGKSAAGIFDDILSTYGISDDEFLPITLFFELYSDGIYDNEDLMTKYMVRRLKGYHIDKISKVISDAKDISRDFIDARKRIVRAAPTGAVAPEQLKKPYIKRPFINGFVEIIRRMRNHIIRMPAVPSSIALMTTDRDFSRIAAYALGEQEADSIVDVLMGMIKLINNTVSGTEEGMIENLQDVRTLIEQT